MVFYFIDSCFLGKWNFLNWNLWVRNWNNIGIKCNELVLNYNIIENVIKVNLNFFIFWVKLFYFNLFVFLMVFFLFLWIKNCCSIFCLFLLLVWMLFESVMVMRNISDYGIDMVWKCNIIEVIE